LNRDEFQLLEMILGFWALAHKTKDYKCW